MAEKKKKKCNLTMEARRKGGKASRAKYAYGRADTAAKKLDLAVKQTLSTLIIDVVAYNATEVVAGDQMNMKDRKSHLQLINQEINAIMKMRDMAEIMRDEAAREMQADVKENRGNIKLIKEARTMLDKAGLNPEALTR